MSYYNLPHKRKMWILAGVLTAMLLGALDATIVGPAMPKIVQELGGMAMLSWVFTIYSLASTITVPIVGKLSDLYGRKWFYLGGISIFLLGSALCGMAGESWMNSAFSVFGITDTGMTQLIIFRGIQGIGGGMMMANAMAIIGDMFEPRERARYQGLTGAVFGFASVFGPLVGGWLTDTLSWRWIFYVNLPFGILALGLLATVMPASEGGHSHRVDWWGATALASGLVPLLLALNWGGSKHAWNSGTILGLFAVSLVMLVAFVFRELRASEPILDMRLFKDRSFSASMLVLFLTGVGMFGSIVFLPTFMQIVQGKSASSSGALLMPLMLSMIAASMGTGQIIARTGRYKWYGVGGLVIAAVGMLALAQLTVSSSSMAVVVPMALLGAGLGVTMPLFTISLQAQFRTRIGEVTGALQFFRSMGGTVGVALLGGVMNASMRSDLASRLGEKGVPALQTLWATSPQPGPLSPVGLQAVIAQMGDKLPVGGDAVLTEFVGGLHTIVSGSIPSGFDPSGLLNVKMLDSVGQLITAVQAKLPAEVVARLHLTDAWATLVMDLKLSLTAGVTQAFLYGSVLLALGVVAMLFVREIPLTARPHLDTAAEIGTEILIEEAVLPAEDEPVLVDIDGEEDTHGEVASEVGRPE